MFKKVTGVILRLNDGFTGVEDVSAMHNKDWPALTFFLFRTASSG